VLVRLFGKFMRGQVISLTVRDGSGGVGVGRQVMEFCDSIVRTLWHGVLLSRLDVEALSGRDFGPMQRA
jgi:hypothetical protein